MSKYKFFKNVKDNNDLRSQFKSLAKMFHPDFTKDDGNNMKIINNEFESLSKFQDFYNTIIDEANEKDETKTEQTKEQKEQNEKDNKDFQDIVNDLINIDDIEIELVNLWIWIKGNTKAHKEKIKKHGFYWSNKNQAWYKKPCWYKFTSKNKDENFDKATHYKDKTIKLKEGYKTKLIS